MSGGEVYLLYILFCRDPTSRVRSYVGITNNLRRRLKQHRGELSGGAKYTTGLREKGCQWVLGATAHGFVSHAEVLKVEWALQHHGKSKHLKQRVLPPGFKGAYLRNLDNLFFITHQVTRYRHISAIAHAGPKSTLIEVLQQRYNKFALLPERLLLEHPYQHFINSYYASIGQKTLPRNGNENVSPKPKPKPSSTAEAYRAKARELLARSRIIIDLRDD
jgi:predicted GIY-YIG superfamily endonuclease